MSRFRIRIYKRHGGHIFYYIGRHRWRLKGGMKRNYYYRKSDGAFFSPAPKKSFKSKKYPGYKYHYLSDGKTTYKVRHKGSLASLKAWWDSYKKNFI